MTYEESLIYLDGIGKFSVKNSGEHTGRMLTLLGNPENRVPVIHVAGTNGKGSVCTMLAQILQKSGRKTALFLSPHLVRITERISIDGREITEEAFAEACTAVREASETMEKTGGAHPSWFEFLFLAAMWYFARAGAGIAVLETGLGGRLDATNAIRRPLLTVITRIGLDHTQYLGETICEIAAEKAGILKAGVPCAALPGSGEAETVLRETAEEKKCPLVILQERDVTLLGAKDGKIDFSLSFRYDGRADYRVPAEAPYQADNAALVLAALKMLKEYEPAYGDLDAETVQEGLDAFAFPARMQRLSDGIYLDGGHNPDGVTAAAEAFSTLAGHRDKALVFAAMKDKNVPEMVRILADRIAWRLVVLTVADPARGMDPEAVRRLFAARGIETAVIADPKAAVAYTRAAVPDADLLICGSLYLAGAILNAENRTVL